MRWVRSNSLRFSQVFGFSLKTGNEMGRRQPAPDDAEALRMPLRAVGCNRLSGRRHQVQAVNGQILAVVLRTRAAEAIIPLDLTVLRWAADSPPLMTPKRIAATRPLKCRRPGEASADGFIAPLGVRSR